MKIWTKRILLFLICMGVAGCLAVVWLSAYVKSETAARILSTEEAAKQDVDCILVLGCGVRPDGTPSLMLTDRLETGIALYRAGAAEKLLMSGDHGTEDYDEVNTMKRIAKESGVPSADIFMDHAGFSTYDSVYRAKEIFCAKKGDYCQPEIPSATGVICRGEIRPGCLWRCSGRCELQRAKLPRSTRNACKSEGFLQCGTETKAQTAGGCHSRQWKRR